MRHLLLYIIEYIVVFLTERHFSW